MTSKMLMTAVAVAALPFTSAQDTCKDLKVDDPSNPGETMKWYDSRGEKYTCKWYERKANKRCSKKGHKKENFGLVANEACCVCHEETPIPETPIPEPTCPPRVRKAWSLMTCDERLHYATAVKTLKETRRDEYDGFVSMHLEAGRYAHGTSGFLPWHRYFVLGWENALRSLGGEYECITLPYWDWERHAGSESESPVYHADHFGTTSGIEQRTGCVNNGIAAGWDTRAGECLRRSFGGWGFTGQTGLVSGIVDFSDFDTFANDLEGAPHAAPHVYTGGQMGTYESPEDPLFMIHHCNVDRVWALWQDYYGYDEIPKTDLGSLHYSASGPSDLMSSLSYSSVLPMQTSEGTLMSYFTSAWTIRDMMHITDMPGDDNSYVYGDDNLAGIISTPANGEWNYVTPVVSQPVVVCPEPASRSVAVQSSGATTDDVTTEPRCSFDNSLLRTLCAAKVAAEPAISNYDLFNYLALLECDIVGKPAASPEWISMMVKSDDMLEFQTPCWFQREDLD
eukprot:TRINITY_DN947_c0_g1_i2.p1 TRINITY_DN947_c0_g1~~TRINITY_DN947_c0_g1_i2.p1  ORF type:complete len:528 (+),score=124.59 TRINITY_DN947_c0_g1_i2:60-1586(+)